MGSNTPIFVPGNNFDLGKRDVAVAHKAVMLNLFTDTQTPAKVFKPASVVLPTTEVSP